MPAPFIVVSTFTIKEGKLEAFRKYWKNFVEYIEKSEPHLIAFEAYINQDGTEVTNVQIHPDGASMAFHLEVIREHLAGAYLEFLEITSIQYYATPGSDAMVAQLQHFGVEAGYPVIVKTEFGGFNRLPVAAAV